MANLTSYNGRYCEQDFEDALIQLFAQAGWTYTFGEDIAREKGTDVLITADLRAYLMREYNDRLTVEEIDEIISKISLIGAESEFATMHRIYMLLVNGWQYIRQNGEPITLHLIHFEKHKRNTFRVVNQMTIDYVNNGQRKNRRPDLLLYVNGLPLCIIELKNPSKANATIADAYEQIHTRYWRDIPHLLHYCPLAMISDGVKTRLGTVVAPYEHFYAWRRVENDSPISTMGFDEVATMVQGVFTPTRFLEIFRDYIYFQDSEYDFEEKEIVCRYPQFFATRLLRESVLRSVADHSGKGGTYFGATGCGKTFTMAFLARQLSVRCAKQLGSPTIVMIVDRDDLQKQGAKLFTKSTEFLGLGEVRKIVSRRDLRQELSLRPSGGFYICTIQKFCDRKEDIIGVISTRSNIICFSDEAHRTQIEKSKQIRFDRDADENMRALVSKPYAKVLHEAFPNATFVGFTGTPIAETYQTFGDEVDRYTMDQAVADGITVPIKYHPRIAKVLLDETKVRAIEAYYRRCAEEAATEEDIQASKKAMSSMEIILGEPERLQRLAADIHHHFTSALDANPTRKQKAMIVCANRQIAYNLLLQFHAQFPEWFEDRLSPDDNLLTQEQLKELRPMPTIAMVATVGKNDPTDMYNYLGGVGNSERNDTLDACFKQVNSNFRIVIVVDMWITGFDVPCLTYLYNDKPLQKHTLIQTISRVNRKDTGKEYGLIIDYIGIRNNMLRAMKTYGGGGTTLAPTVDDIEQAYMLFKEQLEIIKRLFHGYDLTPFLNPHTDGVERYRQLSQAAEFVFANTQQLNLSEEGKKARMVLFKTYFLKMVQRMRAAYDICQPSDVLSDIEVSLAQCFMAIAGFVRKMSGTSEHDTESMNRQVRQMVEEALRYNNVVSILDGADEEDIFDAKFEEILSNVPLPATKLELLVKMLKKRIAEYGRTNALAAKKYQEMLEDTIKQYHERKKHLDLEEAGETQEQASSDIIRNATEQALNILTELNVDRESFRQMGLTFEEKAFYDILLHLRDEHNFEFGTDSRYGNDRCKDLAKKIKEIIDTKSAFSDWLNNQRVRDQLKLEIKICLVRNGYPPQYSPIVFQEIMGQVENYNLNIE
ncbi:MAG: HsdR family type I site-specific deoxyribonuclease [Paludibacter sp.]|nr:HsdR family type I site-specific deoxyribonuclease [Bacteroidales bacterium]MCM1069024.1 HsdR family type I site-specific deoxyribonuclease [Prevotella sp.]MCM1353687.1 HsdR family type I site-specific deoxyribonuclease [Bacteroides sp.]MCM1441964.1 HsdR family type I site-specific deoxyribonuclease [Muribaculum sp.]MCM1481580.1 HsdR family type I site-specific deoxyribonuclease [Paludibacter sp.]